MLCHETKTDCRLHGVQMHTNKQLGESHDAFSRLGIDTARQASGNLASSHRFKITEEMFRFE